MGSTRSLQVVGSLGGFEAPIDVVANAKYIFIDDPGENTVHAYTQPITSSIHRCDFGDDNEDNTIGVYAQGAPFASGEAPLVTVSNVSPDGGGPQALALDSSHLYVLRAIRYPVTKS